MPAEVGAIPYPGIMTCHCLHASSQLSGPFCQ